MVDLVLGSTSPYRRALLERLGLPFETVAPGIDEQAVGDESAPDRARRLAVAKADAVALLRPGAVVVASDQVSECGGRLAGKPLTPERNVEQLMGFSGRAVVFHTGLCVVDGPGGRRWVQVVPYTVEFRDLTAEEVSSYVSREAPLDCAGGFKAEGLGISLFRRMRGPDPTALVGLPLIALGEMLRGCGLRVP